MAEYANPACDVLRRDPSREVTRSVVRRACEDKDNVLVLREDCGKCIDEMLLTFLFGLATDCEDQLLVGDAECEPRSFSPLGWQRAQVS